MGRPAHCRWHLSLDCGPGKEIELCDNSRSLLSPTSDCGTAASSSCQVGIPVRRGCDLKLGAEISLFSLELLLSGYFMMAVGKETKTIFK